MPAMGARGLNRLVKPELGAGEASHEEASSQRRMPDRASIRDTIRRATSFFWAEESR
jgi:hypothetical protein